MKIHFYYFLFVPNVHFILFLCIRSWIIFECLYLERISVVIVDIFVIVNKSLVVQGQIYFILFHFVKYWNNISYRLHYPAVLGNYSAFKESKKSLIMCAQFLKIYVLVGKCWADRVGRLASKKNVEQKCRRLILQSIRAILAQWPAEECTQSWVDHCCPCACKSLINFAEKRSNFASNMTNSLSLALTPADWFQSSVLSTAKNISARLSLNCKACLFQKHLPSGKVGERHRQEASCGHLIFYCKIYKV